MVDDFEGPDGRVPSNDARGGWWFSYDDGTGGTLHREEVDGGAGGQGRALHVVSSGFLDWGAGFGASLHPSTSEAWGCPYDASAYSGIRLKARGRGRLRLMLGDAASTPENLGGTCTKAASRCYDRPGVWVSLSPEWQTFEFPFCAFTPEGWGEKTAPVAPATLFGIHFRASPKEDVEAWLDDLELYRADGPVAASKCKPACPLDLVPQSAHLDAEFTDAPVDDELTLHTFEQRTAACGSLVRRYLSFVPRRLGPRSSAPVLLMFHGSRANAESARHFMARDRFDALATRDGFIVVYPNAAPGAYTSPQEDFPNTGAWRQGFFDDGQVNDVEYVQQLLRDLEDRGMIAGDNPLYMTGISNGGGMVLETAKRLPGRFRGFAAFMPYDGEAPSPVPDLRETSLKRVLFAYTIDDPGMAPGYHTVLAPLPGEWAAAMGIPRNAIAAPRETSLPNLVVEGQGYTGKNTVALATRDSRVVQLDMQSPAGDARVRVLRMDHAGHFWPNPVGNDPAWVLDQWGFRNQDFDAANAVWEFLRLDSR